MVSLTTIISVSLFFTLCAADHAKTKELPQSLQENMIWEDDDSRNVGLSVVLPNVAHNSKCLAIAKKNSKSLADKLYLKVWCSKIKLPEPNPRQPSKKPKVSKKPTSTAKPKPGPQSKPKSKPKAESKPKQKPKSKPKSNLKSKPKPKPKQKPKQKTPVIPKTPKIQKRPTKSKKPTIAKKLTIPKIPKISQIPKIPKMIPGKVPKKIPKTLPKTFPKVVPKVPTVTIVKRKKPSPSPSSRSKKKSAKKAAKPTPKRLQTPSPQPPSPIQALEKIRQSLESVKKRLVGNIQKHETKESKKVCKTEDYICGKKCSGRSGPPFLCYYPNHVPKFCTRKTAKIGFCEGKRVETCSKSTLEPGLCERNVTVTEYCPGVEQDCRINVVQVGKCLPDKNADECERITKRKCVYETRTIDAPCKRPKRSCGECKGGFRLKNCATSVMEREEVPCSLGKMGLPGLEEERKGTGVESMYVRDLLCFDSFFAGDVCNDAPRVCRLFDEMFDRYLCAMIVCQQCGALMKMHVSEEVKQLCKSLVTSSCVAAREFVDSEISNEKEGLCYASRKVEKMMLCYEPIADDKICDRRCVMKACKKRIYVPKEYCERHLPERCMTVRAETCKRDSRKIRDCSGQRVCEYVVKKQYLCFKERREDVPCSGGCEFEAKEKYACGSKEAQVEGVCREQFEYSCQDVMCSRQVCD